MTDTHHDNWENTGTDDFYAKQADLCRDCNKDVGADALDDYRRCEACRAQPARLTLDQP